MTYDPVNPDHYKQGTVEAWDVITSLGLGYLDGNTVKYICRYKHKNGLEDLLKARAYLDKLIGIVERCPYILEPGDMSSIYWPYVPSSAGETT